MRSQLEVLVIGIWTLEFICDLVLEICDLIYCKKAGNDHSRMNY